MGFWWYKPIINLTQVDMKTIIKNEDGTFWVRYCGMYVGTFATYKEALVAA